MQVKEILKNKDIEIITTTPSNDILTAMELLISKKISCLPVIDNDYCLIGIISDKDIFKAIHKNRNTFAKLTVNELMSTELIVGLEDDKVDYISGLMTNNRIRHIPIVENDKLVGLVSIGDVVKAKQEHMEIENRYLKQYIDGSYPG